MLRRRRAASGSIVRASPVERACASPSAGGRAASRRTGTAATASTLVGVARASNPPSRINWCTVLGDAVGGGRRLARRAAPARRRPGSGRRRGPCSRAPARSPSSHAVPGSIATSTSAATCSHSRSIEVVAAGEVVVHGRARDAELRRRPPARSARRRRRVRAAAARRRTMSSRESGSGWVPPRLRFTGGALSVRCRLCRRDVHHLTRRHLRRFNGVRQTVTLADPCRSARPGSTLPSPDDWSEMSPPDLPPDVLKATAFTMTGLRPIPVAVTTVHGGRANGLITLSGGPASVIAEAPRVMVGITKYNFSHDLDRRGRRVHDPRARATRPSSSTRRSRSSGRSAAARAATATRSPGCAPVRASPVRRSCSTRSSYVEARVTGSLDNEENTIFVGDVVAAERLNARRPARHRRGLGAARHRLDRRVRAQPRSTGRPLPPDARPAHPASVRR